MLLVRAIYRQKFERLVNLLEASITIASPLFHRTAQDFVEFSAWHWMDPLSQRNVIYSMAMLLDVVVTLKTERMLHVFLFNEKYDFHTTVLYLCLTRTVLMHSPGYYRFGHHCRDLYLLNRSYVLWTSNLIWSLFCLLNCILICSVIGKCQDYVFMEYGV